MPYEISISIEDAGLLCYQLHPIVASYARDQFDEQGEQADAFTLFACACRGCQVLPATGRKNNPSQGTAQRGLLDFHDFVEAVWHWCRAERQAMAYELPAGKDFLLIYNAVGATQSCLNFIACCSHWIPGNRSLYKLQDL